MKKDRLILRKRRKQKSQPATNSAKRMGSRFLAGSAALLAASAMVVTSLPAKAATLTWDVRSGDGGAVQDGNLGFGTNEYHVWGDGLGNWNMGAGDTIWSNAIPDDAIFGGGTSGIARTVAFGSNIVAGSLTFTTPNAGFYTLDTGAFSLTLNSGITANETATIRSLPGGSVVLGGDNTWAVAAGKTLTVNSDLVETGGARSLTKTGAGMLVLGGTASHTGGTFINAGILRAAGADSLGAVVTFGGGTLQYTAVSAAGTDYSDRFKNSTSAISLDTNGQNVQLTGIIDSSNTGGLAKLGLGTLVLSGANTFTGDINVGQGFVVSTGAIPGAAGLSKTGDGTLILRGTSTYTGQTTLNGGITLLAPTVNDGAVLGAIGAGNQTVVNSGATLAFGPDANGAGAIGNPAELLTINGDGFRNNGALRFFMGVNSMTHPGVITLGSASRIQADQTGTFTLSGAMTINQDLKTGGVGFVSLTGAVGGSNTITHYGLSGFRMQSTAATQNYSGTINSILGEIRADTGTATLANAPYNDLTALNLRDSWLRIAYGATAGAPTAGDTANSHFSTTAPISMRASAINLDNSGFTSTSTSFFDYAVAQSFGTVTLESGFNRIGFRSADAGSVTLTFADILKPNPGTALEFYVDSLSGAALGTAAKHQIINTALEGGATVPFVGGWAYSSGGSANQEFVKYVPVSGGGFGYTPLVAADYAVDTAETGWTSGQNIKLSAGGATITANRTIQSLNIQNATARTLAGNAGTILEVGSGGILTSLATHTISVPFLTAGAGSNYELYDIAPNSNVISSSIIDNGANPVSLVKLGINTTSFLTANTYTGTTYINEGMFRGVIGATATALGSGNLIFGGSPTVQAVFENDGDFTRALGTGVGEVQFLGGGGLGGGSSGFSAFGAPIDVNFGGAGATVTWGSATFNPGIFGLNGGNATHVVTLKNPLDLGGEQRYVRLDGSASAAGRAVIGIIEGNISNGSLVKRGGGILLFENAKSYEGGTIINEGDIWLRGAGTLGANVMGNDIQINSGGRLLIDSPSNIGSNQWIVLQNGDVNTPVAISFGAGYGTGSDIHFQSFSATGGVPATGPNNIFIVNDQAAQARRIAVTISGNHNFQADLMGDIFAVAPNVEAWFGADNANGTFTGTTITASGGAARAFRLGGHTNNGALLTIANANVLSGNFPLFVGMTDQNDRNYTDGIAYMPQVQNYAGQVTIGSGGILHVGTNGALSTTNNTINLRAGELRVETADGAYGGTDAQYAARILDTQGANSVFRTSALSGGGYNTVTMASLNFPETGADRAIVVTTMGTPFINLQVGTVVMPNAARTTFLDIGSDNSFQSGNGILTVTGVIADQATGAQGLEKRNGGVLILQADNTYDGLTRVEQGRLVLSHVGAAGTAATNLEFNTNSDRTSQIEFRLDGAGPHTIANAAMNTGTGGNDGSTRIITVGPTTAGTENATVILPTLTIGHAGTYTVGGSGNSALFFDGFNGFKIELGNVILNRDIALRTRGAVTTIAGVLSGAAGNDLEKNDQGTLVLNGNNTYAGTTTLSNGTIIAGHDNAFGTAISDITFRNTVFSQVLASGVRTISRNFINTATGSTQTIGGLDAGAKLFSGNVNMSTRGVNLLAVGGDVTFSGVISGGFGIEKQGNGKVSLTNGNTYTATTIVTQGILAGNARAVGSPFGTGAITVNDGELQLIGQAAGTTTTAGALTIAGGARLVVDATAGGLTNFTFASLARTGAGSVTFGPATNSLNTNEVITFTAAPTLVNTIIGPWAVRATSASNNAADYVTISSNNVVTATYGGSGDLDTASGPTQVFDAGATGGTLTADRSVFAFRTNANINLAGFTLNVGDNATPARGAGIILNNGADIGGSAGSTINIGNTALNVYVDDAAISSLSAPIVNTRNNNAATQTTVFTKFGLGTLEIGTPQTFQGNIELNRGTLSLTAANVFPLYSNLNGTTGSVIIMSPGTTINLNNNNQEFGNLSGNNPSFSTLSSAGTIDLGTATLTVGREDSTQSLDAQLIGGTGSKLVKVGAGTLTLSNINGNRPNTLTTLEVNRGTLAAVMNDQSWAQPGTFASAIPSSTDVILRGGTWQVRSIGDSTGNLQRIAIGNNITVTGGDSGLSTVRDQGSGANKLLTFNNLTLSLHTLTTSNDNTFIPRFDGITTLTNIGRIATNNNFVLAGAITDGGNGYTLVKTGASDIAIGADNSATWSGGLIVQAGTVLFGSRGTDDIRYQGTTFVPSATANAGSGDIVVNLASILRLNAPTNVVAGQDVHVIGVGRGTTTRVELGTDAALASYKLRSLTSGSVSLNLAEGHWTTPINMALAGDNTWGLSATTNTYYTAATLGANASDKYLFHGSNAATLSFTEDNVLTGSNSVEVGKSHVFAGGVASNSTAIVRIYGDQNYAGNTTIFRGADAGSIGNILELTGDSDSSVFDVYGRLTLRGDGRVTNDAGAQVNTVNLRPGGNLRLDYSMDVADNFIIDRLNESNLGLESDENKWGDSAGLVLDGAGINLINHSGRVNQETVGAITIKGGAGVNLERNGTSGQIVLKALSLTRSGQATLEIRPTSATAELGSVNIQSAKLFVTTPSPTETNGMVAPWIVNSTGRNFVGYNTNTGFTNTPFVTGTPVAGGGDAFLSSVTATDVVQFSGTWGDTTLTGTKNVYALRVDEESSSNDMIFTGGQINIHSGGLIAGADDTNRVDFNTTAIYFGNGTTPVEGIVYGGHSSTVTRFGGAVTANNLTFTGPGQFQLAPTGTNAITGTIQLNGGTLYIDGTGAKGSATEIVLHSNYSNNFNGGEMPSLRLRHNSATTTYTGMTVTVAENVPVATIQGERFSGTSTTAEVQFDALNVLGTAGPAGTQLYLFNSNSNVQVLGATTLGGNSTVGINVNTATWRLTGTLTSAGDIIKTGDGVLRLDGNNDATFSGAVTLNRGELRLTGPNVAGGFSQAEGTGDYTLNFGTLRLAAQNTTTTNSTTTFFDSTNQDITVAGQVTFINDRNGGTPASGSNNVTIGAAGAPSGNVFRTTNSAPVIFQAAQFGDDIRLESQLVINDSPLIRTDSTDLFLRDVVSGVGTFNKGGIWYLHFDNNDANIFSGGFNNFTGVTVVRQTNATLGTGAVQVFAGTALSVASTAQFGATGLTKVYTSGTAIPVIGVRSVANLNAITAAVAGAISGTGRGVLSIDAGQTLTTDPAMATRDGGAFAQWYLAGGEGNGNLTANSVTPWGTGSQFLLGGGFGTLTIGPATAGSAQFAGAGNSMVIGAADTVGGYGVATFNGNGNNTYDGGTLVTRSRNLDGGYRGHVLSVQGGANGTGTTFRTPLGTGQIDLFGDMRYEGSSGTAANSATTNANVLVMHMGSRLRLDNNTPFTGSGTTGTRATGTLGGGGRWADTVAITLNSSVLELFGDNSDHIANREIVGDLTIQGGSEVGVRRDTGDWAELSVGNITRSGTGTLQIVTLVGTTNTAGALGTVASNVDSSLFLAANGASLMSNNMVAPWIVSRSDHQFLKYDAALGFRPITQGGSPANYISIVNAGATTLTAGGNVPLNNGTEILSAAGTTNYTLGSNLDLHALRLERDIDTSANSAFNQIIIRSGGLIQVANTPTINANLLFGAAGDGTGEALIWANNNTLQINGKIFASQVTKSGVNFLSIRSDQPQFTGNWVVNGGGLQFLTPGAQSTGEVILNGAHMTDNDNTFQITEVRYNFNSGTPDLFTWGGGKITVNDIAIVRSVGVSDRLDQLPAIDLKSSGGGHGGLVFLQSDNSRHTVRTGTVTLYDNYTINTDAVSFGSGSTSGFQLGSGTGAGGLNNQGLYDVRLSGDGLVSLGDNSASFTGVHKFDVGDGRVRVLHNGAFGAATASAIIASTGSMEIAVSNFVPTATLTQQPGSIERWAVSDARGTGNYSLPSGVHLQVATDLTGTRTIDLSGGSIMGYLPQDYTEEAVIQTIRSGVTINLTANSYLGQPYPAGTSNGNNHIIYDMGKLNTSLNNNPSDVGLRGSYLVIDGNITGSFSLTKVGQDVIKLAGSNSFTSLSIEDGVVQMGRNNALAATTVVNTRGDGNVGILDLNGYNQEIGGLTGSNGSVNNSAFENNILAVNNVTPYTYGGNINGSVTLHKKGAGTFTLTSVNPYEGGTILESGVLSVAQDTSLGRVHSTLRPDSLRFTGGTLQTTADMTIASTRGITLDASALQTNKIEVAAGTTLTVASPITSATASPLEPLTKAGAGTMQVTSASNYQGATVVDAGTLEVSGSLTGTASVTANTGGTLLMNGNNIINDTANVILNGGKLQTGAAGTSEGSGGATPFAGLGTLSLTANSVLDFGTGNPGLVSFSGLGAHTAGTTLTIDNWTGNWAGSAFSEGLDGVHDRLIFAGVTNDFTSVYNQSDISFTGTGPGYNALQFDAGFYEIVPVPEPATTALIGSVALCALIGLRERRRLRKGLTDKHC